MEAGSRPVATIAPQGQVLRIVHVDRAAAAAGIRPGQTLADAKALVPQLATFDDDPLADRQQLESLAILAGNLAPTVHIEGDDTLFVDVTGCERLYHGEENILRRAVALLHERGFSVRCAIADTLGAAWALAHAHPEPAAIAEPGQTPADLAPLPVWSLRIDALVVDKLATVGVETIGSLFHLPRSSLTSRFGEALLERMDQALGDVPEVLRPYRPATVLTSRWALGAPTDRLDVLVEAVHRTLETFCHRLTQRVGGVRQIFVTFHCPDVVIEHKTETRTVTIEVNLSHPTRSAKHLLSLFKVRLESLVLPAPADMLMIWSREIEPWDDWQTELFDTDANDPKALGVLFDRLAVRLSPAAVVRAEPVSDHQPEKAFQYVTLVGRSRMQPFAAGASRCTLPSTGRTADPTTPSSLRRAACPDAIGVASSPPLDPSIPQFLDPSYAVGGARPAPGPATPHRLKPAAHDAKNDARRLPSRPLRLLFNPLEIQATALVPEGPPISFRLRSAPHRIVDSIGPERIETGWWRGPHVQRDYYRVLTDAGRRAWIFRRRDTNEWFLHGWFD